ncbi:MAG: hypothetical protein K6A64_02090 [Bacteroidales bacterium]|nr:hypothetical protein [Bacteroidales bacterium]
MQKSSFLAAAMMLGAMIVSGLTACTKEGDAPETEVYEVCIHAANGSDAQSRAVTIDGTTSTSIFTTSERVYVYNQTTNAMLDGYLEPSNLSENDTKCDLVGTLTGTISQGDILVLLYNLSVFSSTSLTSNRFDYRGQNGLASGALDGAIATVTAMFYESNKLSASETAEFENLQSIFRFKFVDESSSPITVSKLSIYSENGSIAYMCTPLDGRHYSGTTVNSLVTVNLSTPTSDYLYVALGIKESVSAGDVINFTAIDDNGEEYRGTKAAPSSGFNNGKYYYNSSAIHLTKINYERPTITWTSVKNGAPVEPSNRCYLVYGPDNNPSEITISGNSYGYYFQLYGGSTVTLSNLTATLEDVIMRFIYSNADLNIIVDGTNSITCTDYQTVVYIGGALKLSGNGTLTVTAQSGVYCGMYGSNYQGSTSTGETEVTDPLAAPGFKVIRSARTDHGDGTYTWTYTVTPINYLRADYTGSEWL